MDLSSLRALVRNLNFEAHGVDIVLDRDPEPIATRGIWITPETENVPGGTDLRRRELSYVLAVPRTDIRHGEIILAPLPPAWPDLIAPPPSPGGILRWQVDGFERAEADHMRPRLVLAPDEES